MQKYLKIGLIFGAVLIILVLLKNLLEPSMNEQIKSYLINNGYVIESDDTLLHKYIDSYTTNYFSLGDYTLNQSIDENSQSVTSSLNQTYDYKSKIINYNYHAEYSNNVNVILRGEYKDDNFTCYKEFSSVALSSSDINNTCSLIKIKVLKFNSEANVLFKNYDFIKYMEKSQVD